MHRHAGQRGFAGAAVDRDHAAMPGVPTEEGYPQQLTLDDEGGIGKQRDQRKRLPYGLMLGRDHDAAGRDFFEPTPFDIDAAYDAQQPQGCPPPQLGHPEDRPSRQHKRRYRRDQQEHEVQVK
jgi:hypothetical protein